MYASGLKPITLRALPEAPLVSVLVANYNHAAYVGRAIESVRRQTYAKWEVVVCDDGSTDDSLALLETLSRCDRRITVVAKDNGGHASALNAAFVCSRGEVVAILDADDEWFPQRIELTLQAMRGTNAGMVCHPLRVVGLSGELLKPRHPRRLDRGWLLGAMLQGAQPYLAPASGLTIRREVAELAFPLPEQFTAWADRVLGERCAMVGEVVAVREVLGLYRQHGANLTGYLGSLTLAGVERDIERVRAILRDRASFARLLYPKLELDTALWERRAVGVMYCVRELLSGRSLRYAEIRRWCGKKQSLLWALLFLLPLPVAQRIYLSWRSGGMMKRYLGWAISPTHW